MSNSIYLEYDMHGKKIYGFPDETSTYSLRMKEKSNIFTEDNDERILKYLDEERICYFCGKTYKEVNNMGRLECFAHYGKASVLYDNDDKKKEKEVLPNGPLKYSYKTTCCQIHPLDICTFTRNDPLPQESYGFLSGCIAMDHNDLPCIYREKDDVVIPKTKQLILNIDLEVGVSYLGDQVNFRIENHECGIVRRFDEFSLHMIGKKQKELKEYGRSYYRSGELHGFAKYFWNEKETHFFVDKKGPIVNTFREVFGDDSDDNSDDVKLGLEGYVRQKQKHEKENFAKEMREVFPLDKHGVKIKKRGTSEDKGDKGDGSEEGNGDDKEDKNEKGDSEKDLEKKRKASYFNDFFNSNSDDNSSDDGAKKKKKEGSYYEIHVNSSDDRNDSDSDMEDYDD